MPDVPSYEDRDRQLALLCRQLPRLRLMHRGPVGARKRLLIDRAVRAAREGEAVDGYLRELGLLPEPLPGPPPGDPLGDPLGDRVGNAQRGGTLPPRVEDTAPHTLLGQHVCPRGVCSRSERRAVDGERPVCEVFDAALRFDPES